MDVKEALGWVKENTGEDDFTVEEEVVKVLAAEVRRLQEENNLLLHVCPACHCEFTKHTVEKADEVTMKRLTRGRPKGRKCVYCGGEGTIYPEDERPDRVCGNCAGTGVVR